MPLIGAAAPLKTALEYYGAQCTMIFQLYRQGEKEFWCFEYENLQNGYGNKVREGCELTQIGYNGQNLQKCYQ